MKSRQRYIKILSATHFLQLQKLAIALGYRWKKHTTHILPYMEKYKYFVLNDDVRTLGWSRTNIDSKKNEVITIHELYEMESELIRINNNVVRYVEQGVKVGCTVVPYDVAIQIGEESKKMKKIYPNQKLELHEMP